jgi:hypothetical protein
MIYLLALRNLGSRNFTTLCGRETMTGFKRRCQNILAADL